MGSWVWMMQVRARQCIQRHHRAFEFYLCLGTKGRGLGKGVQQGRVAGACIVFLKSWIWVEIMQV
jgi:hypothetical protein